MLLNPARQCESWNMMRLGSYVLLHVTTSYSLIWSTLSLTTAVSGFSVFCPFSSLQVVHLCLSCLVDKIFVRWFCVDAHIKKPVAVTCVSIREHRRKFGLQAATEVAPTSLPASAFETQMTYRLYMIVYPHGISYMVGSYAQATCDPIEGYYCVGLFEMFDAM